MEVLKYKVYLAALLHDIGKFYQRADTGGTASSKYLSQGAKALEQMYCPEYKGISTHKHVLWTAQFFIDFEKEFNGLLLDSVDGTSNTDSLFRMASSHHKPSTVLEYVIQKADHYSSGIDRTLDTGMKDGEDENTWDAFKKKRMCSIFETLLSDDSGSENYNYSLPVGEVTLDDGYFPKKKVDFISTADQEYQKLWVSFTDEFRLLSFSNITSFSETLLYLLQKYTSNIPSSTIHLPDVSLFDHLKSTAAMAVCLYIYLDEKNNLSGSTLTDSDKPFLLIGGDISGIQAFIYDIISKRAAKNLKGRSFYLQILVESVIRKILDELELFDANVVYSSGGGFYILAPNTTYVNEQLGKLSNDLSDIIFDLHGASLYLAMDSIPISQEDIFKQKINEPWRELTELLNLKKRQRFKHKLIEEYGLFFEPIGEGGSFPRDVISDEEIHGKEGVDFFIIDKEKDQFVTKNTIMQIELGKSLKDADYWVISYEKLDFVKQEETFGITGLNTFHYFFSSQSLKKSLTLVNSLREKVMILKLNDLHFMDTTHHCDNIIQGFYFYGGNDYPTLDGEIKTFDQLAGSDDHDVRLKRLGVLRMDVDNLGQAFISGFSPRKRTFSRYSALSRGLDHFFKGYLNTIWESDTRYKDNTYILYSGGDDLFIVGKWDFVIDLARKIRERFIAWSCSNKNLGISGGIAIVPAKFPISKAADIAGKLESQAKRHKCVTFDKNAISFFSYPLNWDNEFPVVEELKNMLVKAIEVEKILPKSIIGKIQAYAYQAKNQVLVGKTESWRWMIAYDFSQIASRLKKSQKAQEIVKTLTTDIFSGSYKGVKLQSNYSFLEILNIASRWAELEIRN